MGDATVASPALCAKLAKVLGMLGSDHDGEVAAAGRRAHTIVKGAGLTWDQLLTPLESAPESPPRPPHPPPRRWRRPLSHSDAAALCLLWPEVLTPWENEFCRSLVSRYRLSPKQSDVLNRITAKVEAFARSSGETSHV